MRAGEIGMDRVARSTHMVPKHTAQVLSPAVAAVLYLCFALLSFIPTASAQFGEVIAFQSPGETTYYLDADTGDDENPGTRPNLAWKSLTRINATRFAPGDKLFIKAGTAYHGRLWPKGSGRPGNPITIDSFADGPRPAIHAGGKTSEALLLENTQGWHIRNLELTNTGDKPEAFRYGLSIVVEDMGTAGGFELSNLFVHGVNGSPDPGLGEGAGIIWRNRGTTVPTRFDGLLIEKSTVTDCGRNGIVGENGFADRTRRLANLNIIIRENEVSSTQGDGIRLTGSDNAMIEYNRVRQAGSKKDGRAGGIVLIGCDNSLVQYNEVWQTKGQDNAALLCDTNSRNNTFQFNYTHENVGPMTSIRSNAPNQPPGSPPGQPPGRPPTDAGNDHTAVRYNISQNDGGALRLIGPVTDARFHNNTIYTGPDSDTISVALTDLAGSPSGTILANNLFYTLGKASLDLGEANDTRLQHNAYFGPHTRPDGETGAVTADPLLVRPGAGKAMKDGLKGYQTLSGSPLRRAGTRLVGHGSHDFWANPVPGGRQVDIGAFQAPSDNATQATQPARRPE
jgi:Right handed beta helix region